MANITKGKTWVDAEKVNYTDLNGDFDTIYNEFNGNIDNNNLKAGAAIDPTKIAGTGVTLAGVESLTNKTLTTPKIVTNISDANGNAVILTPATASAVNQVTVTNAIATGVPSITATGSDANIHLALAGKGNGLVKTEVLRQDITTNTYAPNQVILTGWNWILGDGSSTVLTKAITFGVTFTTAPVLLLSKIGAKPTTDPVAIGDFASAPSGTDQNFTAGYASLTTTGMTVYVTRTDLLALTAYRYGFSWIAIGTL